MASVLFVAYLIWVSWQDKKEMQVIRYSHVLGIMAIVLQVVILKVDGVDVGRNCLIAMVHLSVLQVIAYKFQWYGMADVIVLFLCGIWIFLTKGNEDYLRIYFLMQAIAGCLLWCVQWLKKNVKGLCLRHPVAYIPYISFAFILTNMVL